MSGPHRWLVVAAPLVASGLCGCPPEIEDIAVWGTLYACADTEECGVVGGADVWLWDTELALRAEAVTEPDGSFTLIDVPGQAVVFLAADEPAEHVPSSFLGVTGSDDGAIPEGALFVVPLDEAQALIDHYGEGDPDAAPLHVIDRDHDGDGGLARGRFLAEIDGFPIETWPGRDSISCAFYDADEREYPCRYLDKDGDHDPSLETTTTNGGFAAFGLPTGLLTGIVRDGPEADQGASALFTAHVLEDGVTVFDRFISPF